MNEDVPLVQLDQAQAPAIDMANVDAQSQVVGEPIGTVETVSGSVNVTRIDGSVETLSVGDKVYQGDTIETPNDAGVGITLADTSSFSLGENSEMVLDELVYDPGQQEGSTVLSLLEGTASFVSGQIAKFSPDAVSITTPVATIGIRGTKVFLEFKDGQFKALNLLETTLKGEVAGEIVIFGNDGVSLGSTNEANIGWSWNGSSQNAPRSLRLSPAQVETLTRSALSHLPTSLAEEAVEAQEMEKSLKETAETAEEEAAEAAKEAAEAEAEALELEAEAELAAEQAEGLLSEAELLELQLEQAVLELERLTELGSDQKLILLAQVELNALENSHKDLLGNAQSAQRMAELAERQAKHAADLLAESREEAAQAEDLAQIALREAQAASELASNSYQHASTYMGYEANNSRDDGTNGTDFSSVTQTNDPTGLTETKKETDDDDEAVFVEHVSLDDAQGAASTYDVYTVSDDTGSSTQNTEDDLIVASSEVEADVDNSTIQDGEDNAVVEAAKSTLTGKGVDGYLKDATVFIDLNNNGVHDSGEDSAITNADGSFSLETSYTEHAISIAGGTDIATNKAFYGVLTGPAGSTVITPLTTILNAIMGTNGGDKSAAQATLATAFGFDNTDTSLDLTTDDPIAGAGSSSNFAKIAAIGVQLQNTVLQAASVIQGSSTSVDDGTAASTLFVKLASSITTQGSSFDISDATILKSIIQDAASAIPGVGTLDTNSLDATTNIIKNSNAVIDTYIALGGTGDDFLSSLAQVAVIADSAAQKLESVINGTDTSGLSLNSLETSFSNTNLKSAIEGASIGDVTGDGSDNTASAAPTVSAGVTGLSTTEDTTQTITTAQLIANASDTDTASSGLSIQSLTASSGTLVANGDGTWIITPAQDSTGDITLSYKISDGVKFVETTAVMTVSSVNDAPVLSYVSLNAATEDTTYTINESDLLASAVASDVDTGDSLSVTAISVAHGGTATDNGTSWSIAAPANYNGTTQVTYTVSDGTTSVSNTVDLAYLATNDAPTVSGTPVALSGSEDGGGTGYITITQSDLLTGYASDVDLDGLTVQNLATSSSNTGTLVYNGDNTWKFTPLTNSTTTVNFSFDVSDDITTTSGAAALSLSAVNDAPIISSALVVSGVEDQVLSMSENTLLTYASDIEGSTLSVSNVRLGGTTLSTNVGGDWIYTPTDPGTLTFTYDVSDGTTTTSTSALANIVGAAVTNSAPTVSSSVALSGEEDGGSALAITLTKAQLIANASDGNGDTLYVQSLSTSGGGTLVNNNDDTWTYTPVANSTTSVTFTYDITDGIASVSTSAVLSLSAVNDAPVVSANVALSGTEDTNLVITTAELIANASDVENDSLSVASLSASSGSLVTNANATSWTFTPASNSTSDVTFSYSVSDGAATTSASAIASFASVNDAPVVSGGVSLSGNEDTVLSITKAELLANASDVDGDSMIVQDLAISSGAGSLVYDGDNTWSYTPVVDALTDVGFTYKVSDGTTTTDGTATATFAEDGTLEGTIGDDTLTGATGTDTIDGGNGADVIVGGDGNDILLGGNGGDTITGGNGADVIDGGRGSDVIILSTGDVTITAGKGVDTLRIDGFDLNFTTNNIDLSGFEKIDLLTDTSANTLTLNSAKVLSMSESDSITVDGDASDTVAFSDGTWSHTSTTSGYSIYSHDTTAAQVQVTATVQIA